MRALARPFSLVLRFLGLLLLLCLPPFVAAQPQTWPSKERVFHVICGYPPGTGADIMARYFADKFAAVSGQTVIVENKPGMMSAIAAATVARAKPDGYTIFITPASASHATNLFLFKELPYDPIKDFTPVTTLAKVFFILAVDPTSRHQSVKDLSETLRKKGERASYAYVSPTANVASELYKARTAVPTLGVSYKSYPQTFSGMKEGQIEFQFFDSTFAVGMIRSGRLRALAVSSAQRSTVLPEIPTMIEAGIPDFDISPWWAVYLPAGAPRPVVEKLESWFNQIVAMEDTKKFLSNVSAEPFPGNAAFLAEYLPKEIKKWGDLVRLANIVPQ